MSKEEALKIIEAMPDDELQSFYQKLPARAKLGIHSGLVNWRDVLPGWYIHLQEANEKH